MIGKTLLHYKIVEKIGEGGMGVVYKAEDTKLERTVALKFLSLASIGEEEKKRFKREAKAAASLNHPNIATVHAIEESDDQTFIAMEFIEGQSLQDIIGTNSGTPLKIETAIDYATQIAAGLQAAHEKGIVHRDIKSANFMITDKGQVKIMDFGLAKVRGSAQLTKVGTTLGTAAYMSPEQVRGGAADERSDIWSFGVVLYEVLTGKLPFGGDYEQAVTYAILNEEPELSDEIPSNLQRILQKALAKDQTERYQNIDELYVDLESSEKNSKMRNKAARKVPKQVLTKNLYIGAAIVLVILLSIAFFKNQNQPINSIAVLPFVNSNNDPDIEYLSDGITETLITKLSQLPQLRVMARNTVFRFKAMNMTAQQVGKELNVQAVLTGAIVQRGKSLRLNAELVDVSDGAQIWGEQYNRTMDDIFAVQDAISEQISTGLRLKMSSAEKSRLVKQHTDDPEAHQFYNKGRYFLHKRTPRDIQRAIEYFHQAVAIDTSYALAFAGLADAYILSPSYEGIPPGQSYPKAKKAALKALEIDPFLGEAHIALAGIYYGFDWNWPAAEREFIRGIELSPGYATAYLWYSELLSTKGLFDEALIAIRKAHELDPLSSVINARWAQTYHFMGRYREALKKFQTTIELNPQTAWIYDSFGHVYIKLKMTDEALAQFTKAAFLQGSSLEEIGQLERRFREGGMVGYWRWKLEKRMTRKESSYVPAAEIAEAYAGVGEIEKAFKWLTKAFEERGEHIFYLMNESGFDNLRLDPRWRKMFKKVGLEI